MGVEQQSDRSFSTEQRQAICRLRRHAVDLVEGRRVDQVAMQEDVALVFSDGLSSVAGLKDEFEDAELALRICVEISAPGSSMRAHQQECNRVLDALVALNTPTRH